MEELISNLTTRLEQQEATIKKLESERDHNRGMSSILKLTRVLISESMQFS